MSDDFSVPALTAYRGSEYGWMYEVARARRQYGFVRIAVDARAGDTYTFCADDDQGWGGIFTVGSAGS